MDARRDTCRPSHSQASNAGMTTLEAICHIEGEPRIEDSTREEGVDAVNMLTSHSTCTRHLPHSILTSFTCPLRKRAWHRYSWLHSTASWSSGRRSTCSNDVASAASEAAAAYRSKSCKLGMSLVVCLVLTGLCSLHRRVCGCWPTVGDDITICPGTRAVTCQSEGGSCSRSSNFVASAYLQPILSLRGLWISFDDAPDG